MSWFAPFHDLLREHDDDGGCKRFTNGEREKWESERKKVEKKNTHIYIYFERIIKKQI